ncbi:NAD(P)-binding protein [Nostoc sp.]|uniref:NAD(P)-binding protein n=1 Tax=Nostoc sp. TaxID=1180 RepID=UPI002FF5D7A5
MRINRLTYEPSIRIGIVGAGCTGLTAAEELRYLGYKNITIIDAKNRVGGKTYSIRYQGGRIMSIRLVNSQ